MLSWSHLELCYMHYYFGASFDSSLPLHSLQIASGHLLTFILHHKPSAEDLESHLCCWKMTGFGSWPSLSRISWQKWDWERNNSFFHHPSNGGLGRKLLQMHLYLGNLFGLPWSFCCNVIKMSFINSKHGIFLSEDQASISKFKEFTSLTVWLDLVVPYIGDAMWICEIGFCCGSDCYICKAFSTYSPLKLLEMIKARCENGI